VKVLVYPHKLAPGQKLQIYLSKLGIEWTNDWRDEDITHAFHWDYKNSNELSEEMRIVEARGVHIINGRCNNVKKDHLDYEFERVFGYSIMVDPTTHRGTCIKKSTQQAVHNGKFVQCPIKPHEYDSRVIKSVSGETHRRLYQKLIDTRFEMDKLREVRVPIIGSTIPTLFIKELGVKSTFHPYEENYYKVYTARNFDEWLSMSEVDKLFELSRNLGLEFGELDVLRDNSTGLIYVVDVNNIPMGSLFNKLDDREQIITYMSNVLKSELLC
jgi:hypothetical protein